MERLKNFKIEKIKSNILGKDYDLSLVFADKKLSRSLNFKYRKINKPTDVLSFAISDKMGEIFICLEVAKKKAKEFYPALPWLRGSFANYLLFLVIHAILHLKGMEHSSKMERYEFAYYSRYRCRHL